MLKITILVDDKEKNTCLVAEHGFSALIENDDKRILYDFGTSDAVLVNAERLGLDLDNIDCAICSHSHYDHMGGIKPMIDKVKMPKQLYVGKGYFDKKYVVDDVTRLAGADFGAELLFDHNIKVTEIAKTTKIFDNCHIFTDFAKIYDFETVPKRFKKCVDGSFQDDDFSDEICLAIETSRGIVVIVGCSHPGILNIVSQIKNTLNKPVFAIIGGTHLVEADAMRISKTVSEFENLGVQYLGLGHCTGDIAENLIKDSKKFNTFHLSAGDSVNFE